MNKYLKISLIVIAFSIIIEILLRLLWGFGTPPLYVEDDAYEYIYAPNQHIKRFGNKISTNEYSMRSLPLLASDSIVILKIGDSIISGGSHTDNDSLSSTILEKRLNSDFPGKHIRVLNIGAGSWGPDNAFAYIKKHGNFRAKFFVLVFSSHDLYDNMNFVKVVDVDPAWPSKNPPCAIWEVLDRYIIKNLKIRFGGTQVLEVKITPNTIHYTGEPENKGWQEFIEYTRKNNIQLLVLLHPNIYEVENKKYDRMGQRLMQILDSAGVNYVPELSQGVDPTMYRDDIHYNNKGQEQLARETYPYLKVFIKKQDP